MKVSTILTPPVAPPIEKVVIEMTYDEAVTLLLISRKIHGSLTHTSRRWHTVRLGQALDEAGITYNKLRRKPLTGSLIFHDEEEIA